MNSNPKFWSNEKMDFKNCKQLFRRDVFSAVAMGEGSWTLMFGVVAIQVLGVINLLRSSGRQGTDRTDLPEALFGTLILWGLWFEAFTHLLKTSEGYDLIGGFQVIPNQGALIMGMLCVLIDFVLASAATFYAIHSEPGLFDFAILALLTVVLIELPHLATYLTPLHQTLEAQRRLDYRDLWAIENSDPDVVGRYHQKLLGLNPEPWDKQRTSRLIPYPAIVAFALVAVLAIPAAVACPLTYLIKTFY